jgi:hypothetical protein
MHPIYRTDVPTYRYSPTPCILYIGQTYRYSPTPWILYIGQMYRYSPTPCILYIGQTYRYSPEYSFYIFSQQIYLIIFLHFLSPSSFIPPQNVVYLLMLPFWVHKIFTFYINGVLNCKCPAQGPKGWRKITKAEITSRKNKGAKAPELIRPMDV